MAILGPDHPDSRISRAFLGIEYVNAGRYVEGIARLEDVKREGGKGPNWGEIGRSLVLAYARTGDAAKAGAFAAEEVRVARKQFPDPSPQLELAIGQMGKALLDAKLYPEAEPLLREAFSLNEKRRPASHDTHYLRLLHGAALSGQRRFADAEALMLAGYKGMRQSEAKIRTQIRAERSSDALERLVELYNAWGKADEAAKWRAELDSARSAEQQRGPKAP